MTQRALPLSTVLAVAEVVHIVLSSSSSRSIIGGSATRDRELDVSEEMVVLESRRNLN